MNDHSPNMHRTNVEQVTFLDTLDPPRWTGQLQLPGKPHPIDILIFNLDGEFWAVPSLCSHLAYNLTACVLVNGSTLICPAHGERIELKRVGFPVHESQGQFVVLFKDFTPCRTTENRSVSASENAETVQQLQEEVKQLRLASLKQNRKISVITQSMDTMLCESEAQKNKLKEKADKHQAMARFVDSVLNTIEDLLFIIDTKGLILRINTTVEQELGYNETELLGTNIDNLLTASEHEEMSRALPVLPWTIHSVMLETIRLSGHYSSEHELVGKSLDTQKSIYWLKSGVLHSAQGKFEGAGPDRVEHFRAKKTRCPNTIEQYSF